MKRGGLFVLGGEDAEMIVIKAILGMAGAQWLQPQVAWGTHVYSPSHLGLTIVPNMVPAACLGGYPDQQVGEKVDGWATIHFVECRPGEGWPAGTKTVVIDHHDADAGRPASILQVLDELDLQLSDPTRRWVELVAANDAGYIPAMLALGATAEEVERVRALDRRAQGVTSAQEAEAERAVREAERGPDGLVVVRMAHSKCAPVCDRLFTSSPSGRENLLVLSENGEVNYFGSGDVCADLKERFGGWSGGSGLGKADGSAYWGGYPSHEEVLAFIRERITK